MVCIVATICLGGKRAGVRLGCEIGTQICIRRILPEKTQVVLGKELRNLGVGGRGRRRRTLCKNILLDLLHFVPCACINF